MSHHFQNSMNKSLFRKGEPHSECTHHLLEGKQPKQCNILSGLVTRSFFSPGIFSWHPILLLTFHKQADTLIFNNSRALEWWDRCIRA